MKIEIVMGLGEWRDSASLIAMFEDRKRLFVDLMDWDVPVIEGRFEMDGFDDGHCVYLIAGDVDGAHLGSMRLLPTERPHLLDMLFRDLVEGAVPRGRDVWEITRLCLPTRLGAARRLVVRNRLISAMVDHALVEGITMLTGVVAAGFRRQVLDMGWRGWALGPDAVVSGQLLGAFAIAIDPMTPGLLRATGIYSENFTPIRAVARTHVAEA
jgi:acyl-homoserine lactone synthase